MAKPTGFMDYKRVENGNVPPLERICNFKEFHPKLDEKARREQAARCMNCGVPMCQSAIKLGGMVTGCPLHNYIPEWNDALFNGQFDMAAWRLLKTSSFPEFTGRVCPALCEKACNCGSPVVSTPSTGSGTATTDSGAVTVHDNELYIIEKAFESGYVKPQIPAKRSDKKVAVIGAGPAGLAAADWLNRRGHNVTVFEREDKAGGLLMYGIPNMKLDKKIVDRRIELMKAEGVKFVFNADAGRTYSASQIIKDFDAIALCCGAKKARALNAEGMNLLKTGSSGAEESISKFGHDPRVYETTVKEIISENGHITAVKTIEVEFQLIDGKRQLVERDGTEKTLPCDLLLVAAGFVGCEEYTAKAFGTELGPRGTVLTPEVVSIRPSGYSTTVDYSASPNGYTTSVEKIFTAGDMHRGQSLVVWAIAEGRECARQIDSFLLEK